jgi:hypothetical protein
MQSALADCREQLARKHPADEYKESEIREWISSLIEPEKSVIVWLFHRGPATPTEIGNGLGLQMQDVIPAAISSGFSKGFIQIDNIHSSTPKYRIHDNYHDAVRNVLHPPERPFTAS